MTPIYLDYNATTPVAPEVADAMIPFIREHFGNPSSTHVYGLHAAEAVREARESVARLIGAREREIVFTGCATEANNLAILGVARAWTGPTRHLIVSAVEHPAVMAPAQHLRNEGWELSVVPVDQAGRTDPALVAAALRPDTAIISVMHANNEVGTLQPVREIAAIAKAEGVIMHTDAAQSIGKVPVDVDDLGVDLLTIAGHKFYAPKGIGALYVRTGTRISRITYGPGQEHGLRPGTENVPAIVGLGTAARLARERLESASLHLRSMRDTLHDNLANWIPELLLNGHPEERLPNTLNLSFPGITGQALLDAASDDVVASVGSACHSGNEAASGVLAAMGLTATRAACAVRLSVGQMTTEAEIDRAASALTEHWHGLTKR